LSSSLIDGMHIAASICLTLARQVSFFRNANDALFIDSRITAPTWMFSATRTVMELQDEFSMETVALRDCAERSCDARWGSNPSDHHYDYDNHDGGSQRKHGAQCQCRGGWRYVGGDYHGFCH